MVTNSLAQRIFSHQGWQDQVSCSGKMKRILYVVTTLLYVLLSPLISSAQTITGNIEVHFKNIGQGDAILAMSPQRECVMLIDSGDSRYPGSSKNFKAYIQGKLPLGSKIDLAVASHPHADHVGSMPWVLRNYRVGTYIDNGVQYDSATYQKVIAEVLRQVTQRGLRYFSHDTASRLQQDFCRASNLDTALLVPHKRYERQFCDRNPNNCSVSVKLTYDAVSFLFRRR